MNRAIAFGVFGLLVLVTLFGSAVIVDSGYVGVVRRLGAVQTEPLAEGFHLKIPLMDAVEEIDVRLRKAEKQTSASSKDLQIVTTAVAVQYSLAGPLMPRMYQRIGTRIMVERALIDPAILESVKAITARYTAEELVTKREEVKNNIQQQINAFLDESLREKELVGAMIIANVAITDFDFSAEFNRAIEEKVRAEQEALKAGNEKLRRVTQAEAAAAERTLAADAQAYEIEVASKARADAIRREAQALKDNPQLIQLRIAEKWDGRLPMVSGGDTIPLLKIEDLTSD